MESKPLRIVAFDIETMVDDELLAAWTPPVVVKTGNLKDPAKIAEKTAAAEQAQRELAALNPHLSRVISAHLITSPGHGTSNVPLALIRETPPSDGSVDECEARILCELWKHMAGADRIVTFNGAVFDVPYIMRRSLLLSVTPSINIETHPYRVADGKSNHIDIRRVLAETSPGNGDPQFSPGNLDYYGRLILGRGKKDGHIGADAAALFAAGKLDELAEYGNHDVTLTLGLYHALQGFYFV